MIARSHIAAVDPLRRSRRHAVVVRSSSSSAQSSRSCCASTSQPATTIVERRPAAKRWALAKRPLLGGRGMGGIPRTNSDALSLERGAQRSEHRKRGFRSELRRKQQNPTTNSLVANSPRRPSSRAALGSVKATRERWSALTTSAQRDFGSPNWPRSRARISTHRRVGDTFQLFISARTLRIAARMTLRMNCQARGGGP
jgi:hypothetical protein